jgi:hypothetical protein
MFKEIFERKKNDSENDQGFDFDRMIKFKNYEDFEFEDTFVELESLILPLVKKLKESIDKGEYDMLIGDDASGRIPTLILRGVINDRNRKLNPDLKSSESEIKTRFVAGGQLRSIEQLKSAIEKLRPEVKKKALVVTEYIYSGKSMERFSSILKNLNIPFDIATLKSEFTSNGSNFQRFLNELRDIGEFLGIADPRSEFGQDNIIIPKNSKFYYGKRASEEDQEEAPLIYDKPEMSGVEKNIKEPYAVPYKKSYSENHSKGLSNLRSKEIQDGINLTRENVNLLVKKILEKVWRDK